MLVLLCWWLWSEGGAGDGYLHRCLRTGSCSATTVMMTATNMKLTATVEAYWAVFGRVPASGGATGERSSYGPLANLLNAAVVALKPKVFRVGGLSDQGAGHPDFGLYGAKRVERGRPRCRGRLLQQRTE